MRINRVTTILPHADIVCTERSLHVPLFVFHPDIQDILKCWTCNIYILKCRHTTSKTRTFPKRPVKPLSPWRFNDHLPNINLQSITSFIFVTLNSGIFMKQVGWGQAVLSTVSTLLKQLTVCLYKLRSSLLKIERPNKHMNKTNTIRRFGTLVLWFRYHFAALLQITLSWVATGKRNIGRWWTKLF